MHRFVTACAFGAVLSGGASTAASAQTKPTVSVGFAYQSGGHLVRDVQHFPLGPNVGLGLHGPLANGFDWGVGVEAAYYVQDATNRNGFSTPDPAGTDPDRGLLLGTAALRIETPRVAATSLFVGAGEAFAISSPRPGDRSSPMVEVGVHPKFDTRASVRFGVQYFVNRVGETRVQVPIRFDIVL